MHIKFDGMLIDFEVNNYMSIEIYDIEVYDWDLFADCFGARGHTPIFSFDLFSMCQRAIQLNESEFEQLALDYAREYYEEAKYGI